MSLIALLPMKGHSERVPGKNVRNLNGRPLFFHIGDTMREAGLFGCLAINTDSDEIRRLASERYGSWVEIIDRPREICGDEVSMNSIISHDISILGAENDFFQTHSTNPLLRVQTITAALNQYLEGKEKGSSDSVFSVNALRTRLYDKDLKPLNHDPSMLIRTQDLDVIYEENSNFYIFSGESFGRHNHRIGTTPSPFVMNRNSIEGLDIDEPSDWELVETIVKYGYKYE